MAKKSTAFFGFNRGLVSRLALARVDMKRLSFSAETMTNWMPRVLGSMMLRPGMAFLGSTADDFVARFLPFVFSTSDTALVELTDGLMRVWVDDEVITRESVSTAVTNGLFTSNLTGWVDNDEAGGTSSHHASGYMQLVGDGLNAAIRDQEVTVGVSDQGVEHALHVVINRGPVAFSVGTTEGGDDYVALTTLDTGIHSLAFTPTGNFFIRFLSELERATLVDSVEVEAAGPMEVNSPWGEADLSLIRADQSGDILFVACKGYLQRKIERRSLRSWSLVWYLSDNGPYLIENATETTIASSATTGNVTLTASRGVFDSGHIGALFRIRSEGQRATASITAQNTFTDPIEVTGVGEARRFAVTITGTWSATVTLQRSIGVTGNWVDVDTYTSNVATTFADTLDNQIVFYRLGVKTGGFTSGTAVSTIDYPLGSITGVVRITGFSSATSVSAEVVKELGGTTGSKFWSEGSWSSLTGFPTAVAFYEGRLWWAGNNGIFGSVSDDFTNFNPDTIGDSGPINRTVGSGPVDDINWLLPLQRLIVGAEGAEHSVRATSFDEVLTPTNFNIKTASTQGSNSALAVKIDSRGVFVQRGGTRLFELAFDVEVGDYRSNEATLVVPEIGQPSLIHVAVQRLPDTRIHCTRSDGKVAVLVYNHVENVLCWVLVETDGVVEDVAVLPGDEEDYVYYVVRREILTSSGVTGKGYFGGGFGTGNLSQIDGINFATEAALNPSATLILPRRELAGVSSFTHGYFGGGATGVNVSELDGMQFAGEVAINPSATLGTARRLLAATNSATRGYFGGGIAALNTSEIDGILFSNNSSINPAVALGTARSGATGVHSSGRGYYCGGEDGTTNLSTIDGLEFTTETAVIVAAELQVARRFQGGVQSTTHGYIGGGTDSAITDEIDGLKFSDESETNPSATLATARRLLAGVSSSTTGYFGGGATSVNVDQIDGITFSTEAATNPAATLAEARSSLAGIQSPNSETKRYLERWAFEEEARGTLDSRVSDSYLVYSGPAVSTLTGLSHLEGKEVVVWGNGKDLGTKTVSGGQIDTLEEPVTSAVVGLPYVAQWKSTKLAYVSDKEPIQLTFHKRIFQLGFVLADAYPQALRFGPDFSNLDDMPLYENSMEEGTDVRPSYDEELIEFPGEWGGDSRVCIEAASPRPVTVLACILAYEVEGKE